MATKFDKDPKELTWCPGCGNFLINNIVKKALEELDLAPEKVALASGIGCASKAPQYMKCNFFNGLHGRSLPVATAIKAANTNLTVISESGDGDTYGEGGNHFIHTIRRNPDITALVHNNMVYSLTKGQASPTSDTGFVTPLQINGVFLEPFNPLSTAIALDCSFVARANASDLEQCKDIIKQAIQHKGFALVDIFQSCVVFNKVNTVKWFKENTYYLDDSHDVHDKNAAFAKAIESDKLPLGVFYIKDKKTFEENLHISKDSPLYKHKVNTDEIKKFFEIKKLKTGNINIRTFS